MKLRRRSVEERLALVVARALEQQYPQPWTTLAEARKSPKPKMYLTRWSFSHEAPSPLDSGHHELTVTFEVPKWPPF